MPGDYPGGGMGGFGMNWWIRTSRRFVIPPVSDHCATSKIFRPDSPPESHMSLYQSASVIGVGEGPGIENFSEDAGT